MGVGQREEECARCRRRIVAKAAAGCGGGQAESTLLKYRRRTRPHAAVRCISIERLVAVALRRCCPHSSRAVERTRRGT